MSAIETASMMNDIGINISQLCIILRLLLHKIGDKLFEPESKMVDLRGEMIVPQFGEYKCIHEIGSKPELVLYWVQDVTTIFKKEISLLIKCNLININDISRIDVTVGGYHGQGAFRFPMKLLFIIKSAKNVERESSVVYILCKQDNGDILKNTIVNKLQDLFKLMIETISIDNHQLSIDNLYVTGDLAFLVILLGKEFSSPKWCFKCKVNPKIWLEHEYKIGEDWTINALRLVSKSDYTRSARLGVKEAPI